MKVPIFEVTSIENESSLNNERSLDEWLQWINLQLDVKLKELNEGDMQKNADLFNQVQNEKDLQYGIIIADELNPNSRYKSEFLQFYPYKKHFRHYLLGNDFVLFTDCNSLKASFNKVNLSPRVHRWWVYLQTFQFEIEYRKGERMSHVDFFSRNLIPDNLQPLEKVTEKRINLAEISEHWLLAEQQRDQELSAIITKLREGDMGLDENTYEIRAGVLFRKIQRNCRNICLPIIPRSFRWSVINHVHEAIMHLG